LAPYAVPLSAEELWSLKLVVDVSPERQVRRNAAELKGTGTIKVSEQQLKEGPKGLFNVVELAEFIEFDKKAGGQAYSHGVYFPVGQAVHSKRIHIRDVAYSVGVER
jgi:hypothetical protein